MSVKKDKRAEKSILPQEIPLFLFREKTFFPPLPYLLLLLLTSGSGCQDLKRLGNIIKRDPFRMDCLHALRTIDLPQGYIGAGFVRNAIWDELHEKVKPTPLNDIDVIYFSDEVFQTQSIHAGNRAGGLHGIVAADCG